jgi:aminopeptidase
MELLAALMKKTDQVRILGPENTDISFSIKDMPRCVYAGKHNLPDGEVFTVPVKNSVEGRIQFNVASVFYGYTFENIAFEFKQGRIVDASCNHTSKLNEILDQDEGARYIGEFALGLNPKIMRPVGDVLFDEKIAGSIHLTPGNCYKICDNGNRSSIHWDLILIQTAQMGGGEIYFDNQLIRKDGRFNISELEGLNPEHLL